MSLRTVAESILDEFHLRHRVGVLESAIREHRDQRADDRCIEDDDRLYASLGDGIQCDRRVGDKGAMLENCRRFISQRCESGQWKSYADLERDVRQLLDYATHKQCCARHQGNDCTCGLTALLAGIETQRTANMESTFKCPHCGWEYDMNDSRYQTQLRRDGLNLIPTHDFPPPCRSVCPGSGQLRRSLSDQSALWKDGER